jgi:hypothetical protein
VGDKAKERGIGSRNRERNARDFGQTAHRWRREGDEKRGGGGGTAEANL